MVTSQFGSACNPQFLFLGFVFVNAVNEESDNVGGKKVVGENLM